MANIAEDLQGRTADRAHVSADGKYVYFVIGDEVLCYHVDQKIEQTTVPPDAIFVA